jgi:hypothetical protein
MRFEEPGNSCFRIKVVEKYPGLVEYFFCSEQSYAVLDVVFSQTAIK